IVEDHVLTERFAEGLRQPAMDLPLDDHRVDNHSTIVDEDERLDFWRPGVAIDPDQRDVGAEAPRLALGIEEGRLLQARLVAGWHSPAIGRRRHLAPGGRAVGYAGHREPVVSWHDVFRGHLQ